MRTGTTVLTVRTSNSLTRTVGAVCAREAALLADALDTNEHGQRFDHGIAVNAGFIRYERFAKHPTE